MSVKPILFNTPMVKRVLGDDKTATRRVIKKQPRGKLLDPASHYVFVWDSDIRYPPYVRGDILYVRETWRVGAWDFDLQDICIDYADGTCSQDWIHIHDKKQFDRYVRQSEEDAAAAGMAASIWRRGDAPTRWRPSIHMPKEAARIFLRVTDVRAERLQEITDDGARKEGIGEFFVGMGESGFAVSHDSKAFYESPIGAFVYLWDSTVTPEKREIYGWAANPWVWVIEFERCEKPKEV